MSAEPTAAAATAASAEPESPAASRGAAPAGPRDDLGTPLRTAPWRRAEPFEVAARPDTPLRRAWLRLPVWARLLAIYLASRAVTTAIMLAFAANETETWQTSAKPGYLEFANIWDAEWYRRVAEGGYPSQLPVDAEGHVTESAWAFMPVYPLLIRLVMLLTGAPFEAASVSVSLLAGLGTVFAVYRLFRHVVDPSAAMFGVALVAVMPTSVIFQVGYAESLQALLLAVLLVLLVERRWMAMVPVVIIASLTRPTGLAWACTLVLYFAYRWWLDRKGQERFAGAERTEVGIAAGISVLSGFAWLAICAVSTGRLTGYLDTEFAWRSRYVGWDTYHGPFAGWFQGAHFWLDFATGRALDGVAGFAVTWLGGGVLVLLFFGICFALLASPIGRRLGPEIRIWSASYLLYLFAVFFPQSSTFRLLMPLFPTLAVAAVPKSPIYRVGMLAASVLGQVLWILVCWYATDGDWSPP